MKARVAMTSATEVAAPGVPERGVMALLGSEERQKLARLAKEAWQRMCSVGATDETFEEFRTRLAIQACGRRISEARRGDFNLIRASFAAIAGKTQQAIYSAERSLTEGKRIAVVKLDEVLAAKGQGRDYAKPLFRSICKTTLEEATAKQVWVVLYALKGTNQQRAARRKRWQEGPEGRAAKARARQAGEDHSDR